MKKLQLSLVLNIVLFAVAAYILIDKSTSCKIQNEQSTYLEETYFLNYSDPVFDDLQFNTDASRRETAIEIFEFVRDGKVLYYRDLGLNASEVQNDSLGACWNKALLTTALLRKYGIPSKIIKVPLDPEFLRPLSGDFVLQIPSPFYHCFIQVKLDGEWIYCDPSVNHDNWKIYEASKVQWNYAWDGKTDQILHEDFMLDEFEVIENVDLEYGTTIGNVPCIVN